MITDNEIIEMILRHEGGTYTNDPVDAGGPTKWGITMPVMSKFLGRPATIADIKNLDRVTAGLIYRMQFVAPFSGLPDPLRVNVVDMGVNAGQHRAIVLLQQTIGAGVDGKIGPQTIRLAQSRQWNHVYMGVRLGFYEDLVVARPSQIRFRNGWRNRALSFDDTVVKRLLSMKPSRSVKPKFGFMGKAYKIAA